MKLSEIFQSTPPVREETSAAQIIEDLRKFQSTPPVREETRQGVRLLRVTGNFNPLLPYGRRLLVCPIAPSRC